MIGRSQAAAAWQSLYRTARWKRLRERQLATEPLCRFCLEREDIVVATVADHVIPHKGDEALFYDPDNLQSLCKPCHDGAKQRIELGQEIVTFGADGWPRGQPKSLRPLRLRSGAATQRTFLPFRS